MNLEYFIAQRLNVNKSDKSSVSSPIIKIAIIAIAIGILVMILSLAIGFGLQNKIREKIAAFSGHVVISNFDDNQSLVNTVPISKKQDFYPNFKAIPEIIHIQAVANKAVLIRTEETVEGVIFKGVGLDYNFNLLQEYLVKGKLPIFKKDDISNKIIISQFLANRLHLDVNDVCRSYFLKETGIGYNLRSFKIVGIYDSGFKDFDANYIIGDIQHVQKINKWDADQVGSFEVFINNFNHLTKIGNKIYKEIPSTYNSTTILDKYYSMFEWLKLFDFNILVVLIVMIIVSTVNIVVALLVLILERTQTIGILKALGANNWTIRKIFLYNAFSIIVKGLIWGNTIAILFLFLQNKFKFIELDPESYYVKSVPVEFNLFHIMFLNIGVILVCLLILIIPSYIVTKISPVKAIRYD